MGIAALAPVVWLLVATVAGAADRRETYGDSFNFLVAHTKVVQLTGENGERVAICPEYQGRVMTSSTNEMEGLSHGWINRDFIERGATDKHFNNYGGEDRFWLGPEGGPYSLWFAPGAAQTLANWYTPQALNDGPFQITSQDSDPFYRLARRIRVQNASQAQFDLEVHREIHLQKLHHFGKLFGSDAQQAASSLRMVGFQTINTLVNRGPAMTRTKGLVAIWILGQFPAGRRTSIIVPYKDPGDPSLGPVVNTEYFGDIPPERLRINSQAIWFAGDGNYRSKIGVPQARVKPIAGSIDLENGVLTLVHFSMPDDPTNFGYVNNFWGKQEEPYRGDVFNSYNDGPPEPGKAALGGFYELESLSPAAQLPTGKTITHTQATFHIEGDAASLARVAKAALGVDIKVDEVASEKSKR
ncbi:MAG: hypothetical protein DWQ37_09005 [Planctomycetota bacterium]|nr:MAG: hypothetical protein DWQ37_09005 [Planctomycetota bacterium]